MATPTLPRAQSSLTSNSGPATLEWRNFFSQLLEVAIANGNAPAEIAGLEARVEALEQGGASFTIAGLMSVQATGSPASGSVQISLVGDSFTPGPSYYYGTDEDGSKTWTAVADAVDAATDELTKAVDSGGITTFGLADVPDSGGGTLQRTAFDAKGRKTGTSAATTDDLAEGSTNLYFTDEKAQDAVVRQTITDGVTDTAPSQNAVYDALRYTQTGVGAVVRETSVKVLEQPSPQDYGASGDGITDDTTPIADSISASPEIYLDGDYLVTSLTNVYGVPLRGEGRILTPVTGGNRQINTRVDQAQHLFGQEYLYAFHTKLMAGAAASMVFSGDSTTLGGVGQATTPWLVNEVVLRLGRARGHNLTAINSGHANEDTADWVNLYLASDLATAPDLYVVRWGINDPDHGRDLEDFTASLRAGLAQCRASYGVDQMSILLMVPNNTNDTPNGRDQKWYEQIRKAIRQAARDYLCACIDTYAIWNDANSGTGMWMDDVYGDGRSLHPMNVLNGSITSVIADFIFPAAFDPPTSGTYTPIPIPSTNCSAAIASAMQWMRVGNTVTVSGQLNVTPTAASGLVLFRVPVPVPPVPSFSGSVACVGAANVAYTPYAPGIVVSQNGTGNAQMGFYSQGTSPVGFYATYTYRLT